MPSKLLSLIALSALVLFASALSIDSSHLRRNAAHHDIALSKHNNSTVKHCKPRSNSSQQHHHSSASTHSHAHSPAQSHSSNSSSTGNHAITVSTGNAPPKIGIADPLSDLSFLKNFKTSKVGL